MILSEFVEIKWSGNNKKYYIEKGYVFTKIGENFNIKIGDLSKGNGIKVHVKCDVCGNEKYITYQRYIKNINNDDYYACSPKCCVNKRRKTNLKKYGVENPNQSEEIKNKTKQTNLKRYGVENVFQSEEIKEKVKETNIEKYGFENPNQSEEIKDKIKATFIKKYGFENVFQSEEIKDNIKRNNLEKYGFEYTAQVPEIKKKVRQTMIKNYGEIYFRYIPKYNVDSIFYIDLISEITGTHFQHALNGGEKKFVKYFIDGYNENFNICIEWDEENHFYRKQKAKDLERENYLIETHGCKIVRINEKEFLLDIDNQMVLICEKINKLTLSEVFI